MAITVRRTRISDAQAIAHIMAEPNVYGGLLQMPHPDAAAWEMRLKETFAPGKADLLLVAERDGQVVGSAGLHPVGVHLRRRHVMMLGISVATQAQRQGVGSALMQALCDYADGWANVLRLELGVFTDNVAAIALYRKFGFVIEGTQRAYALRDGRYVDSHMMARLHPNPPQLPVDPS